MATERIVVSVEKMPPATGNYVPPPSQPLPPPPDVTPGESGASPSSTGGNPPPPTPPIDPPESEDPSKNPTPGPAPTSGSGGGSGSGGSSGGGGGAGGDADDEEPITPGPAGNGLLTLTLAVTAASVAFDTLVYTVKALDDSFQEMIRRASDWNANVGMAAEMADLRTQMAEWRRANFLERELVDYSGARSDLDTQIKELVTVVSKDILPLMSDGARTLADVLFTVRKLYDKYNGFLPDFKDVMIVAIETVLNSTFGPVVGNSGIAEQILNAILKVRDEIRNDRKQEFEDADFVEFRKSMQTVLSPVLSRVNGDKEKLLAERPEFKPFFPD